MADGERAKVRLDAFPAKGHCVNVVGYAVNATRRAAFSFCSGPERGRETRSRRSVGQGQPRTAAAVWLFYAGTAQIGTDDQNVRKHSRHGGREKWKRLSNAASPAPSRHGGGE